MTIAEDFAETYIEFLRSIRTKSLLLPTVLDTYSTVDLMESIIKIYWAIANAYDLAFHKPVPENDWLNLMNHNFRNVFTKIIKGPYNYDSTNIIVSVGKVLEEPNPVDTVVNGVAYV